MKTYVEISKRAQWLKAQIEQTYPNTHWAISMHENLGWHCSCHNGGTAISYDYGNFYVYIGEKGGGCCGYWCEYAATVRGAVNKTLKEAHKHIDPMIAAIENTTKLIKGLI